MTMIRKFLFWRFLRPLGQTIVKACEYLVGRLTAFILVIEVYQIQSLVTDGIIDQLLSLLHTEGDVHASVTVRLNLLPGKLLDVALAESCQTREEKSPLQHL